MIELLVDKVQTSKKSATAVLTIEDRVEEKSNIENFSSD